MQTTTCMPDLDEPLEGTEPSDHNGQPYFIANMSSGWTRFENSVYGDYDTNGCRPGLIAYLSPSEKALYPTLIRLTVGYSRTWTRVSLTNLQTLTGLSRNSVITASQSLLAAGLIESRNDGGVTEWRVLPDAVLPFIAEKNAEQRREICTSKNPTSAKIEPNRRENRAKVVQKSRQSGSKNEPPTRKEINKKEKKKKKGVSAENAASSPSPESLSEPKNECSNLGNGVTASPPRSDKLKAKAVVPLAVAKFHEVSQRYPNKALYNLIAETVGEKAEDLQFWGEVVLSYIGLGWSPVNLNGMLEFYRKRVLPSSKPIKGGQHAAGNNQRSRRNAIPVQFLGGQSNPLTAEQFFAAGATDLP